MIISLVGPNAIGKTTAMLRYVQRYGTKLTAISADLNLVCCGIKQEREKGWQGTAEEKQALVEKYARYDQVTLIESARTTHLNYVPVDSPIILLTCPWQLHEKHMRARCEKKGKRFRDDYWKQNKLEYECSRRYINFAEKSLITHPVKVFNIEDQERDWEMVDNYFGSLFRKAFNKVVQEGH